MRSVTVNIPKPCHENWDKMLPQTGGRHCDSCQMVVKDFTKMSDEELIRELSNAGDHSCGRFREDQVVRVHSGPNWRFRVAAFFTLALARIFGTPSAHAQGNYQIKTTGPEGEKQVSEKNIYSDSVVYHIRGTVISKKTGDPLSFASVQVKVNGKPVGNSVYSDARGNFEMNVPAKNSDDVISISYSKRRFHTYTIKNYQPDGKELKIKMRKTFKAKYGKEHYIVGRYAFVGAMMFGASLLNMSI